MLVCHFLKSYGTRVEGRLGKTEYHCSISVAAPKGYRQSTKILTEDCKKWGKTFRSLGNWTWEAFLYFRHFTKCYILEQLSNRNCWEWIAFCTAFIFYDYSNLDYILNNRYKQPLFICKSLLFVGKCLWFIGYCLWFIGNFLIHR